METIASQLIDLLGGTTAVHQLTKTPISTVHSWRRIGLSGARLDHLRLHAEKRGLLEEFDRVASKPADAVALCGRCGERAESVVIVSCTSCHCPMRQRDAA